MELPSNQNIISSREIAEITGKRHSDVLNAIRKMEPAWEKTTGRKFSLSEYIDNSGRSNPEYLLNKTESLFIGSKFNDEARAKLVIRWESLEIEKVQFKPLTQLEILAQSTQILIEQDKRIGHLESTVNKIVAQTKTTPDYYTVVGYATMQGISCPLPVASKMGRAASKICKDNNIPTDEIPDPRFGRVKTYPLYILENVFKNVTIN